MTEELGLMDYIGVLRNDLSIFIKNKPLEGLGSISIGVETKNGKHYGAMVGIMKRCPHCLEYVLHNVSFCPECGQEFPEEEGTEEDS